MHFMYCGMPKGTSCTEAMSNSEKIRLVALTVVELHLLKGRQAGGWMGRQAGRQLVEISAK